MKNETSFIKIKEHSSNNQELIKLGSEHFLNKESILFRNVGIQLDIFNTTLEKDIKRLPANLRFIKKYLYLEFLPKIDKLIDELEKIKKTSNYDEKAIQIKPLQITKSVCISCCDLFDNHNVKHMRSNKIIYGTLNGNIIIYDFELNKNLIEKFLGTKGRVEILSTSTIKVFDSLISRIAVNFRGDPNVTILSYNHSYNTFNPECVINLKDNYANFTMDPNNNPLNTIPSNIKFSKDTYFMTVFDYMGGIRVYKFNEIPQSPAMTDTRPQKRETAMGLNFLMGKSNCLERKISNLDTGFNNSLAGNTSNNHTGMNINLNINNIQITANLIGYYKHKEVENFTIIGINRNINNANPDLNDKNKNIKNNPVPPSKKEDPKIKKGIPDKNTTFTVSTEPEEGCYNNKQIFDENNNDLTTFIKYCKNNPDVIFIQKKIILEEKLNGGFSSCTVTIGLYICFYGSTQFKYISLYPYLTDNMKNVFKVTKSKAVGISQEESMSLASSMVKKEKDYINFIKSKLDPIINSINNNNNINSNINTNINSNAVTGQIVPPSIKVGISSAINPVQISGGNISGIASNFQNPNYSENTKSEFNFNTLVNISHIAGQNQVNQKNSLIAIGMVDGSILIWDTELHCNKFLFQDHKNELLSMTLNLNYLTTASKDGQIFIYDLIKGNSVLNCYHNPYQNFPVFHVIVLY